MARSGDRPQREFETASSSRNSFLVLVVGLSMVIGCGRAEKYPSRPITLVCPWAAGGGTDRVSRQMAVHLEKELGVPVSVINATGGKGVTGHSRGLGARPDGYTITMITLELNMLHWSGLTDLTYKDCTPLMSVNEDYAALFVRSDARWQTLTQLEEEVRRSPGQLKASGTSAGGAWHLALAGWLIASGMPADQVTWISSTGAGPSLQELISSGLDMVCCSLPEARTLLDAGQVRTLGVMAPKRADGFEETKTFAEQGCDWTLGGWRGLAVPEETPPQIVDVLVPAIQRIVTGQTRIVVGYEAQDGQRVPQWQTFPQFMEHERFDHTWRPPDEFHLFLAQTDEKLGRLLTSEAMRSVNTDRFSPMAFPTALLVLTGLTLAGLGVQRCDAIRKTDPTLVSRSEQQWSASRLHGTWSARRGWINFTVVICSIALYLLLAELVGFVLLCGFILFAMLWWLGTRAWLSAAIAAFFVPAVYQLFANLLRVPLPRGWLGW